MSLSAHPAANLFPLLAGPDLADLAADIRTHGLLEPVTLCGGLVLDGRNRLVACLLAEVEPRFDEYDGDDPVAWVVSKNLHRRHLNESQRGMVSGRLADLRVGANQHAGRPIGLPTKTQAEAAEMLNVGLSTTKRARVVLDHGIPDLIDAVDAGDLAVSAAAAIARLPAEDQIEAVRLPHVARASGENEWYTPGHVLAAARACLGGIDLDPASSEVANREVRAAAFFSAEDDGIAQPWAGRVWLNPPYAQPLIRHFCAKVVSEYLTGEVDAACVLVNNATETRWFQGLLDGASALCLIRGRLRFLSPVGTVGAPLQGQAVLYFGDDLRGFERHFAALGRVCEVRR